MSREDTWKGTFLTEPWGLTQRDGRRGSHEHLRAVTLLVFYKKYYVHYDFKD